jgi:UDP-N-acetylglucosamine 2-epimerase (non-hydrolysing)/GDP/UDP-N,N'-diacetylbacillosamine 2-epimerase (hydrolysing)
MKQRICVVTGSRAEYGLLYWILHDLRADPDVDLQLVVTGMHLSPEFGHTVTEIERDGFAIARRVEMLVSSDTAGGIAKSIGLGVMGMSDAFEQLQPHVVLLLGDRFEILAAAEACLVHGIPLAHIAGGDTTEGAFDEAMRHAITKMAHVHFVTNELSARRVRQLGEDPGRIHVVGSPGLDHLRRRPLLERKELEQALGATLGPRNLLLTFHSVTLEQDHGRSQLDEMLAALDSLPQDIVVWATRPNADTGGREIGAALDAWVSRQGPRAHIYTSLGQLRYLSLMALVDAVVGNSSSGLYEAPSLGVPTVDIGNRQAGRLAAASVVQATPNRSEIRRAIDTALALDCSNVVNPYGDGRTAARVNSILRSLPPAQDLLRKRFHLLEERHG